MGEGGMGMVYLAEHRFLKRRVALKIIRPELAFSPSTRQRFQREAMSVAKLRHENIVSVYDAGEHAGVAYLAMELVEGRGLDEVLETEQRAGARMSPIEAARHARGIARALQCAHDAGIIHRDVKPANVRVTPDARVLLLDFGLSLSSESAALSSAGFFRGTPYYASPEQIELTAAEIDARTDVYSLGVLLYECLTGRVPFASPNMQQLFHKILSLDAPEPRKLNERIDAELNAIVMRAIAKKRDDRFASAGEMAGALDKWIENAERGTPAVRAEESRPKRVAIFASTVALVLVAGGWFLLRHGESAPPVATTREQPLARFAPRTSATLFGTAAFDRRLDGWDEGVIGSGTFGPDDEGPGVTGTSVVGITAKARALPDSNGANGANGRIRGRVMPISRGDSQRTLSAGAGFEFSNGRGAALLLVAENDGYHVRAFELARDSASHWTRRAELSREKSAWPKDRPLDVDLSWNDTDAQLEWSSADSQRSAGTVSIPRELSGGARPRKLLLLVEEGSGRFESWMLEES
jgi:tRNA A-37 threonylcarbamoyl transferase component Bud32